MKRLLTIIIFSCLFTCSLYPQSTSNEPAYSPKEPENHSFVVDRLLRYHDSGEYEWQIREVANAARDYLGKRIRDESKGDRLAAIFDVDETALSNWQAMADCGFCSYAIESKLYSTAHDPAIAPVLELFTYARKNGVAVFFLSGRPESQRELTVRNLNEVGYIGWTDLVLRPAGNNSPARVFKS
jgi:predicted secreted acid phosphatase